MKRVHRVDFAAVRAARIRLDAVAREHPELVGKPAEENARAWESALEREEPPVTEQTQQAAFRLPVSLLERVDAFAAQLRREQPGLKVTRADAVRMLLTRALEDVQVRHPPAKK